MSDWPPADGLPSFVGRAAYSHATPSASDASAKIMVFVEVPPLGRITAMLDTGAPYFIVPPEQAKALALSPEAGDGGVTLHVRGHATPGHLHRLTLTLVATHGNALQLEATVFVPATEGVGRYPAVIGYHCCLDRLVFAVDGPKELLYFGDASGSL
ncbi:MAG: hypothetical protein IPG96_08610 [Proteobacteria bacterium]|nr:hypothetical protein [Pseudomonadota bacterium]